MQLNEQIAAVLIFVALVFDFFDGMVARALKAYSDIGKELDSLADVISFGAAPAFILLNMFTYHTGYARDEVRAGGGDRDRRQRRVAHRHGEGVGLPEVGGRDDRLAGAC